MVHTWRFYLSRLWVHRVPNFSLCCQPLWRFVDDVEDERLLVYRSEDIKDFSRLQSPKVCGYLKLSEDELLPKGLEDRKQNEGECPYIGRAASLKQISSFNSLWGWRGEAALLMPLKTNLYFCALCSRTCLASMVTQGIHLELWWGFESFWSLFPLSFAVSAKVGVMTRNRRRRGVKAVMMTIKAL